MRWLSICGVLLVLSMTSSCAVVNQGEVGLKRVWGEIDPEPLQPGLYAIEVVSTDVIRVPIRTTSKTIDFALPSKEGLNVSARLSILYHIDPARAVDVISNVGVEYEETFIGDNFRQKLEIWSRNPATAQRQVE